MGTRIVQRDANPKRTHAITFEHLAKLGPINAIHLHDLIECFRAFIDAPPSPSCTVLGLTESGIVPSFAMQKACEAAGIDSEWRCSSRDDTGGLRFRESHSHAPEHFLPHNFLDQIGEELWIVEDEVTSGRTIENLLECVYDSSNIRKCRVFALLDARSEADRQRFDDLCQIRDWDVTLQSILRMAPSSVVLNKRRDPTSSAAPVTQHFVVGESIAAALPSLLYGDLQGLQHITLSPWAIDGEHVVSRQSWDGCYYIYNALNDEPKQIWGEHV
ncbi:phosphoribosyltransferase domain-containing protein [Blastopirellula sp. JC732]|uniref:Phosphoribosyltransferase domain-containing protein n=1 Tax=Blastopirellula sediminis TaxID=2894196 RepID=A0A9X1MLV3_9BACT|nr:phosphoribosyltransferase domain-containing protein [Blastopirellula sediminis]MCC9608603.1 phosphoribosyltransferase domain-containing protein [Blastopirellula sediminis]MCC9628620.1 phosphoribosyltransferase domain-containing protein [Blastopirellula sediminis]